MQGAAGFLCFNSAFRYWKLAARFEICSLKLPDPCVFCPITQKKYSGTSGLGLSMKISILVLMKNLVIGF